MTEQPHLTIRLTLHDGTVLERAYHGIDLPGNLPAHALDNITVTGHVTTGHEDQARAALGLTDTNPT